MKLKFLFLFLYVAFSAAACVNAPQQGNGNANTTTTGSADNATTSSDPNKKIKIGFSMATVKEERWQRDREAFDKRCKELNVDCRITVADNNKEKQANDVDNLLTQGIDVLVIAPDDATQAASMVDKAKAQNVPVISYDRLINSDKIDLYVSHQVPVIGRKMAEYALAKVPKGNYVMVYGDAADNNSLIMKKAQMEVLQPAIDRGDIKIVAEQHAKGWSKEEALKIVENALTQHNNNVQAIIASNDGTAGGAVQALSTQGLLGKVLVTGQDAQIDALQSIAESKQTMTVYKAIIPLANTAVDAAVKLAKKESLTGTQPFRNDKLGKDMQAILLEVVAVDKDNLLTTVIKDGYANYDEVFKNVAADKRPPKP
ncbi:MAG TPA: substrate-binding domain-containing protein [Pyrinomonadaceae bacterium]|nr:substrate-binding domain-containing protein [Pyrinomonadaceae bacterium]